MISIIYKLNTNVADLPEKPPSGLKLILMKKPYFALQVHDVTNINNIVKLYVLSKQLYLANIAKPVLPAENNKFTKIIFTNIIRFIQDRETKIPENVLLYTYDTFCMSMIQIQLPPLQVDELQKIKSLSGLLEKAKHWTRETTCVSKNNIIKCKLKPSHTLLLYIMKNNSLPESNPFFPLPILKIKQIVNGKYTAWVIKGRNTISHVDFSNGKMTTLSTHENIKNYTLTIQNKKDPLFNKISEFVYQTEVPRIIGNDYDYLLNSKPSLTQPIKKISIKYYKIGKVMLVDTIMLAIESNSITNQVYTLKNIQLIRIGRNNKISLRAGKKYYYFKTPKEYIEFINNKIGTYDLKTGVVFF